jgi:hypothetical protein
MEAAGFRSRQGDAAQYYLQHRTEHHLQVDFKYVLGYFSYATAL